MVLQGSMRTMTGLECMFWSCCRMSSLGVAAVCSDARQITEEIMSKMKTAFQFIIIQ